MGNTDVSDPSSGSSSPRFESGHGVTFQKTRMCRWTVLCGSDGARTGCGGVRQDAGAAGVWG
jgi:hypothetical protein